MKNVVKPALDLPSLQATFVTLIQPRLMTHARIHIHEKCAETKADKIAEVVALAWKWFLRLVEQGKDATKFITTLADFAVRAVKNGRRVAGMAKAKDAMNEHTQQRRGFRVELLPISPRSSHGRCSTVGGQSLQDAMEERLHDNTMTPVPEQAAFRIDYPAWRQTRTERDRRIIDALMAGERTSVVSRKYGLSAGRISQLRRQLYDDWQEFCASPKEYEKRSQRT